MKGRMYSKEKEIDGAARTEGVLKTSKFYDS